MQNIQKSGKTLLEMINDILDLAKIESGKMETRLTDFRIAQVVAAQCDMARPLTEQKNIDLESRVEPDLPPMHQDQARVQQILNNLLSNAIKFTPEGGRITVAVRPRRAELPGAAGERHGRGHRRGGPADDLREVPPGADRRAQRRRHDPRVFRQRPGAVDRQGVVPAAGRRGLGRTASWARAARSRSACRGCSRTSRGSTRRWSRVSRSSPSSGSTWPGNMRQHARPRCNRRLPRRPNNPDLTSNPNPLSLIQTLSLNRHSYP